MRHTWAGIRGQASQPCSSPDELVRLIVKKTITASKKTRSDIAREMAERLNRKVTVTMLNDFTAETKQGARFPAAWVPIFCDITDSDELQRYLMGGTLLRKVEFAEQELAAESKRRQLHDEMLRSKE